MEIKLVDSESFDDAYKVREHIKEMVAKSRFNVGGIEIRGARKPWLKILEVRLNEKKDYCGNHPFGCPVRPWGNQKHARRNYLEGADWVEWDDRINDVLDELNMSANVKTAVCIVRKGRLRRMEYWGHSLNEFNNQWDEDCDDEFYEDWCGSGKVAPASNYPADTPGLYERTNVDA
jgi:hypothetical protein